MGHEPRHRAVAVDKGVDPQQPVVGSGSGNGSRYDAVVPAEMAIGFLKVLEERRQRLGADRDVSTDAHMLAPKLPGITRSRVPVSGSSTQSRSSGSSSQKRRCISHTASRVAARPLRAC
jgi:hypothetical protein